MRYYAVLIPLLALLAVSTSSSAAVTGEEDANSYDLPNAFMIYDVIGRISQDKFNWRVKYVDLVTPRIGTCLASEEECNALGVHPNPRRRYFMSISEVPVPVRSREVTFDITLTSESLHGDSYNGTGKVTVECDEDECVSKDRFFLPVGNVPYTTYLNGKSVEP